MRLREIQGNILEHVESIKEKLTDSEYKNILEELVKITSNGILYTIEYTVREPGDELEHEDEEYEENMENYQLQRRASRVPTNPFQGTCDRLENQSKLYFLNKVFKEIILLTDEEHEELLLFQKSGHITRKISSLCLEKIFNMYSYLDKYKSVNVHTKYGNKILTNRILVPYLININDINEI